MTQEARLSRTTPEAAGLYAAIDATWPPVAIEACSGWTIRIGAGGGKRVSAATRLSPGARPAVAAARMRELGQRPLFMIRPGEASLDSELAGMGYALRDPVTLFSGSAAALRDLAPPGLGVIECDFPLAAMAEIWATGGIGSARLAVMARGAVARTYLLARADQALAGVAFAALAGDVAMIHAIEVVPAHRRAGHGRCLIAAAAAWGAARGAVSLVLAVTDENTPAIALYRSMGMEPAGRYHYRQAMR